MVLALIILISLCLLWLIISPSFEIIGKFIRKYFKELFSNDEGDEKNEKR
ncbi:hypothetical protein [Clostridium sp. D53t1_180928_C8]|nr:hypothetical protein [Clostridium sp. D53t1_180928_C8]